MLLNSTNTIEIDTGLQRQRAAAFFANKDYDKAIEDLSELIRISIPFWQSRDLNDRGRAWIAKGDLDKALSDFERAIDLDPNYAAPYINRGQVSLDKGDYDHAIADYTEAIRVNSKSDTPEVSSRPAYTGRGLIWLYKGEYSRAIDDYDKAIELDPKSAGTYELRALSYLYGGQLSDAQADLDRAIKINSKDPYILLWLHILERRSSGSAGRLREASIPLDMTKWPAPIVRLFLDQVKADAVQAAAVDQDKEKMKGQVCEANFYIGELSLAQGAREEAARHFRLAAADCPKNFLEWPAANAELKALGAAL